LEEKPGQGSSEKKEGAKDTSRMIKFQKKVVGKKGEKVRNLNCQFKI